MVLKRFQCLNCGHRFENEVFEKGCRGEERGAPSQLKYRPPFTAMVWPFM